MELMHNLYVSDECNSLAKSFRPFLEQHFFFLCSPHSDFDIHLVPIYSYINADIEYLLQ